MNLTMPYPPSVNRMYRTVNGRMLISQVGREYKHEAGWIAKSQGAKPLDGPIALRIDVFRPQKRGDIDNCLKCLLDTLNEIC